MFTDFDIYNYMESDLVHKYELSLKTRYALLKCSAQSRLASFKLGKISF